MKAEEMPEGPKEIQWLNKAMMCWWVNKKEQCPLVCTFPTFRKPPNERRSLELQ
ncbi:hypothetical protein P7K49_019081, partial [Saguinus oedipus]